MSTMKQPADKGTTQKKLKLNKETVKDLSAKGEGPVGGGTSVSRGVTCSCADVAGC